MYTCICVRARAHLNVEDPWQSVWKISRANEQTGTINKFNGTERNLTSSLTSSRRRACVGRRSEGRMRGEHVTSASALRMRGESARGFDSARARFHAHARAHTHTHTRTHAYAPFTQCMHMPGFIRNIYWLTSPPLYAPRARALARNRPSNASAIPPGVHAPMPPRSVPLTRP